jgi:hypothetical protein
MLTQNVLYYGKDDPLPERIPLRAGPLTLFYEAGDLRYIKLGDREIIRRIYTAVRDRNWGTVAPVFSNFQIESGPDSFRITYDVHNQQNEIDFAWCGEILGQADGSIRFTMDGTAHTTFMRNRIGFCVLHPSDIAGTAARVWHVDGSEEAAHLPETIVATQPVQPFAELAAMAHQVEPGVWAKVAFSGDIFEMEDQRNWTDASYKTFCTPLRIPYPAEVQAGTRIAQTITLTLQYESVPVSSAAAEPSPLRISPVPQAAPAALPALGLGVASHGEPLTSRQIQRLKRLHLDHLRVDLDLTRPGAPERLAQATREAQALGVKLDVAVLVSEQAESELAQLLPALTEIRPPVRTWLVYPLKERFAGGTPIREALDAARRALAGYDPAAMFAAGTNTDIIFMLRSLPPLEWVDRLTFAIIPEAHAFDNASIVETAAVQGAAVATARAASGGRAVMVSPVTFKMRFNPYATGPAPEVPPGQLPPQVDVRQMSLFGAGWTAASLKYLAAGGASSVTYYETSGWRGLMETEAGSPVPDKFQSIPGGVYPMYYAFALVGEFVGGSVLPVHSSDALVVDGLLLEKDGRKRLMVANFTAEVASVRLEDVPDRVQAYSLNASNAEAAMRSPEEFRPAAEPLTGGALRLAPFGLAWLDF